MTTLGLKLLSIPSVALRMTSAQRTGVVFNRKVWREYRTITSCTCLSVKNSTSFFSKADDVRQMSIRSDVGDKPSKVSKLRQKIIDFRLRLGLLPRGDSYYLGRSVLLYETIDDVKKEDFFKAFPLEDTYFSWFRIAELHLWMLLVRGNAEGAEGVQLNKFIIEYMWEDVRRRAKSLSKNTSSSAVNKGLQTLYQEMLAALIAYDEGLQGSDMLLAGAIWNRFFLKNCDNPESLEMLVKYIRRQVQHLDSITRDDFLGEAKVTWLPLVEKR